MNAKTNTYQLLTKQISELLNSERNFICNAAQVAAVLFNFLPAINWAGFYLLDGNELVLGPFQGLPACMRIPVGKGVCGTAAAQKQAIVVQNVNEFIGHIACDARSESEVVIPLIKQDRLLGVLDIDSDQLANFDSEDQIALEKIVAILLAQSDV